MDYFLSNFDSKSVLLAFGFLLSCIACMWLLELLRKIDFQSFIKETGGKVTGRCKAEYEYQSQKFFLYYSISNGFNVYSVHVKGFCPSVLFLYTYKSAPFDLIITKEKLGNKYNKVMQEVHIQSSGIRGFSFNDKDRELSQKFLNDTEVSLAVTSLLSVFDEIELGRGKCNLTLMFYLGLLFPLSKKFDVQEIIRNLNILTRGMPLVEENVNH